MLRVKSQLEIRLGDLPRPSASDTNLIRLALRPNQASNTFQQNRFRERLQQHDLGGVLKKTLDGHTVAVAGHVQDLKERASHQKLDGQIQATHAGHDHVHDDQADREPVSFKEFQPAGRSLGIYDVISVLREDVYQESADAWVIFHDQNMEGGRSRL